MEVLDKIFNIEKKMGRRRSLIKRYESRLIDIDILFYNDEIISEMTLTIPHPKIPERMFTLLPLSELDSSKIHPGLRQSIEELIEECADTLSVKLYRPKR